MRILQQVRVIVLLPISIVYGLFMALRNLLFKWGILKKHSFNVPIINVGNISIGGTGKTPHVEFLAELLLNSHSSIAILSRGYGRKTRGYIEAKASNNAWSIGDEPFQYYQKYHQKLKVFVCEDRVHGVQKILKNYPDTNYILLDDAYQHQYINPSLNILLTDASKPFFSDFVLPSGNLREFRMGADRADIVVVTKCSQTQDRKILISKIGKYTKAPVLFSTLIYGDLYSYGDTQKQVFDRQTKIILLTGIANPDTLVEYMQSNYALFKHLSFHDHHQYTVEEISNLCSLAKLHQCSIVTTEKDAARLSNTVFTETLKEVSVYIIPIKISFDQDDLSILRGAIYKLS
jgi:tetraacyldisaccharide 4'-kinase